MESPRAILHLKFGFAMEPSNNVVADSAPSACQRAQEAGLDPQVGDGDVRRVAKELAV
jgi:hypothetical protein